MLRRGVIDQLDLAPLEDAVQLPGVGLVEVELGDGRRYLNIGQRAELPSAGDQRPDPFEFCELWARYLTNDYLLLPLRRKRGDPPRSDCGQMRALARGAGRAPRSAGGLPSRVIPRGGCSEDLCPRPRGRLSRHGPLRGQPSGAGRQSPAQPGGRRHRGASPPAAVRPLLWLVLCSSQTSNLLWPSLGGARKEERVKKPNERSVT
jgi:hypothetical protein